MPNTINNAALFNQPKKASISVPISKSLYSDDFTNTSSFLFLRAFPTSKKVNSQTREFTSISSFISGEPVPKGAPRMNQGVSDHLFPLPTCRFTSRRICEAGSAYSFAFSMKKSLLKDDSYEYPLADLRSRSE